MEMIENKLRGEIVENLKKCYDPEVSVNIYDLGLIYDINLDDLPKVTVTSKSISAFCPASDEIVDDIKRATEKVDGVDHAEVITTFEPLFKLDMMSDEARMILGM